MLTCSICEKPIYGRTNTATVKRRVNGTTVTEPAPMVCGSCPLNKSQGGPTGKSLSEVRLGLASVVTKPIPVSQERKMSDYIKVKSNVRNKVLVLGGKYPLVFDAEGIGECPVHLREELEREMMMRPGRFSYVREEVVAAPAVVVEPEVLIEEPVVSKAEVEVPVELDQSFLTEEPEKSKKASKKK